MLNNILKISDDTHASVIYVAKDNCYGIGFEKIIPEVDDKVSFYAVKNLSEAKNLSCLTKKKILILMPQRKYIDKETIYDNFIFTVEKTQDVEMLKNKRNIDVHIKVNTGMNRFGVDGEEEFEKIFQMAKNVGMNVNGAYTHLFSNEIKECEKQIDKFFKIVKDHDIVKHITYRSNLSRDVYKKFDFVRSGIDILGCGENGQQCITIRSMVIGVRDIDIGETVGYDKTYIASDKCKVAIIDFGYSNMAIKKIRCQKVLINNRFYSIINVAMDVMFALVDENVKEDDEVIISSNVVGIRICDIANNIKTCSYELLTSLRNE